MGDFVVYAVCISVFFAVLLNFDCRDGTKFPCMFASDRDGKREPNFVYSSDVDTFVNRSSVEVCVEDIVNFVNKRRMGPDGVIGTNDDALNLEQQVAMLSAMLEANFHGGFWASSPWTYKYHDGAATLAKLLYADGDEYLMVSGSRTGYTGMINDPYITKSFFAVEGALRLQRRAPHRAILVAPLLSQRGVEARVEPLSTEGELWRSGFRVKKGRKVVFSSETASDGAMVLEYGYGSVPSAALWSFVLPPLTNAWDWRTSFTYARLLGESFYRNSILPVIALLLDKEEAWQARMNFSNRVYSEESYETDAEREEAETGEDTATAEWRRDPEAEEGAKAPETPRADAGIAKGKSTPPPKAQETQKGDAAPSEEEDVEEEEDDEPLERHDEL
ncbi:hypothetical protein BESB_006370 [Besnoitia besnoiti]|uniref:Transmembrane protein n=1 Tax=Besnoitia besnoiti TaxID=94643 RepID=A0A2A9MPL0_BESBE|nr:hypothetical protein BESB_006370 [Besnoitia besnoiti]PFH38296.1 hypothetical protein BESB_006370 [Besnoitia besnoiti]